jgi:preprotein translocase subunit SecA
VVNDVISRSIPPESIDEQWDIESLEDDLRSSFGLELPVQKWLDEDQSLHEETLRDKILNNVIEAYQSKETKHGPEVVRHLEKVVMLQILDTQWKEHLAEMDYLRKGIGLRGYAQKNPKQEYKREAFEMFTAMLDRIKYEVVTILSKVEIQGQSDLDEMEQQKLQQQAKESDLEMNHASSSAMSNDSQPSSVAGRSQQQIQQQGTDNKGAVKTVKRDGRKVGRNEPCPCGSGKKYKQCHGKLN